ncbi:unnamed protein product [Paramecium sonneborni]|uniref:Uncharacterized protein n=1 Tax=Paramecium sonneborni TaxID=65129 RepID=A0A8S1RRT9_9CILI|nr:unnamed protein product [Paramecium sonneborni]
MLQIISLKTKNSNKVMICNLYTQQKEEIKAKMIFKISIMGQFEITARIKRILQRKMKACRMIFFQFYRIGQNIVRKGLSLILQKIHQFQIPCTMEIEETTWSIITNRFAQQIRMILLNSNFFKEIKSKQIYPEINQIQKKMNQILNNEGFFENINMCFSNQLKICTFMLLEHVNN